MFSYVLHFLSSSIVQQLRVNPRAVDSRCSFKLCVIITFIWHWTCTVQIPTLIAPSEIVWRLMALNIATTNDAGYSTRTLPLTFLSCRRVSGHASIVRVHVEHVSHLVCFLMHFSLLFGLRGFMLQRHVGPTMLYNLGSLARH